MLFIKFELKVVFKYEPQVYQIQIHFSYLCKVVLINSKFNLNLELLALLVSCAWQLHTSAYNLKYLQIVYIARLSLGKRDPIPLLPPCSDFSQMRVFIKVQRFQNQFASISGILSTFEYLILREDQTRQARQELVSRGFQDEISSSI